MAPRAAGRQFPAGTSDGLVLVADALGYFAFGSDIRLRDHVRLFRFI
jgi:hypothetical protein